MRTGSLRFWAVPGVLALLSIAPVRAQDTVPLPTAPRSLVPPTSSLLPPTTPATAGGLPSTLVSGSTQPAPTTGVETLPQAGAHASGPAVDFSPTGEGDQDEGSYFHGLYFTGDYLLLLPRRNALDYAIVSPNSTQTPGGSVVSADYNTESGFRIGTGYKVPGQDWTVGVTYSNFSSHGDTSAAAPAGGALYATLTRGGSYDQVDTASAASNIDYNVIDIDISHRIKVSETFNVNVFGGGRFAWIDQELSAVYNGGPDHAVNDTVTSPVYFNGAGLTFGSEAQWNLWNGLGIYAKARGSLLSGQFRNFLTETTNNNSVVIVNVNEKYDQIVPVAELGMGLNYCSEHWHLSIGYELANWFSMVNSIYFPDAANIGQVGRRTSDLSIEGLAVQLGLVF
jgi:hypothetical protein